MSGQPWRRDPELERVGSGSFRIRNKPPRPHYRVAIEVAYTSAVDPEEIWAELVDVCQSAIDELDRRFGISRGRR